MREHPERRVEPLAPPPGAFDDVLKRASARRYQRARAVVGVTGVFLAGVVGGVGLAGGVSGVQQRIAQVASGGGLSLASPTPSVDDVTSAAASPRTTKRPATHAHSRPRAHSPSHSATATGQQTVPTVPTAPTVPAVFRGRVVDAAGAPVAGMYVYTGRLTTGGFVPSSPAVGVTGTKGDYSVRCSGGPVLLTSWPLGDPQGADAKGSWAATYVDTSGCTPSGRPARVSTVQQGGVVTGTVRTDVSCSNADLALSLWLHGNRSTAVRLDGLHQGDRYLVSGVPAGTSVLGASGRRTAVTLAGTEIVEQDVTLTCPVEPTPTGTPTDTESPTAKPTPSETPTESTPAASTSTSTASTSSSQTATSTASPGR